jgi:hypothetical protein
MYFLANVLARLQRHQNQLKMSTGVDHAPEIQIFLCQIFDVADETLHDTPPRNYQWDHSLVSQARLDLSQTARQQMTRRHFSRTAGWGR